MTPDELDSILASDVPVKPSPSFSRTVMAAVQRASVESPPVPFPWIRFTLGVLSSGIAAAAGLAAAPSVNVTVPSVLPEIICAAVAILAGFGIAAMPHVLPRD